MTKFIAWILSNKTVSLILAGLLVFGVIVGYQTFQMSGESQVYLAELSAAKAHEKTVEAKADQDRVAAIADIAAQNIAISDLRDSLTGKDKTIASLTAHQMGLETALAAAKTDAERVPILTALVSDWTEKFTLSESKCASYEGIVFNLRAQLADKDVVIGAWKSQFDACALTVSAGDKAVSSLRADLRRAKFWGTVKSGVVLALTAEVIYKLIKK
jgi:hypothetical protein